MTGANTRAGRYVRQPGGYRAFIPATVPPEPPVDLSGATGALLSRADLAVGRLDGMSRIVANPDLFTSMYIRREAVLSSRIEGTQSSLDDVLLHEVDDDRRFLPHDVDEVARNVSATHYALHRRATLPLSLRLIREIHAELMQGTHGAGKTPGEFRTTQNWIGAAGASLATATFVPPPPADMRDALGKLERFLHHPGDLPALVHCAIAHAQFEMIHPFLDGNGRVGRLLIGLLLIDRGVLSRPLLHVSQYLERHRLEYYDRLAGIQQRGEWEEWVAFFLRAALSSAEEATRTMVGIIHLREEHTRLVQASRASINGLRLLDYLCQQPVVDVNRVSDHLDVTFQTASNLLRDLERLGLVDEMTGQRRMRKYRYAPYLALFAEPGSQSNFGHVIETTESQ